VVLNRVEVASLSIRLTRLLEIVSFLLVQSRADSRSFFLLPNGRRNTLAQTEIRLLLVIQCGLVLCASGSFGIVRFETNRRHKEGQIKRADPDVESGFKELIKMLTAVYHIV
jgi:hypothetical protein